MAFIRLNNNLNQHNLKKKTSNSRRASPKVKSLHRRCPIHGVDGVHLALLGGLAAAAAMMMGTEGDSPVLASQDGLVAAIPMAITRARVGLTVELMASQCRARRRTR